MNEESITFRVPKELKEKFQEVARSKYRTYSDLLRNYMADEVEKLEEKNLRNQAHQLVKGRKNARKNR